MAIVTASRARAMMARKVLAVTGSVVVAEDASYGSI
jgi:hypothetical protein